MYKATVNERINFSIQFNDKYISVNNLQHTPEITKIDDTTFLVLMDNKPYNVIVIKTAKDRRSFQMLINNHPVSVRINHQSELTAAELQQTEVKRFEEYIRAPMPGLIADVLVHDGENVIDGQPLLILKAMKMENILRAPHDGIIKRVVVESGQKINKEDVLIQF